MRTAPSGWAATRLDRAMSAVKRQVRMADLPGEAVFHYSIPNVQELGDGAEEIKDSIQSDKLLISEPCLLVSRLNPRKATITIARPRSIPTVCSTEFVPLLPRGIDLRFAEYLFRAEATRQSLSASVRSVTRSHQRVESEDITKLSILLPPRVEQASIADFLDRETARIDALVAKQDAFVGLLDEQRRAIVSEAVTGGLGRREAHHASAEAALTTLPSGWTVKRLKHLAAEVTVGVVVTPSKYYADTGVPALRSLNIRPMEIVRDDLVFFDEASNRLLSKSMLRAGDLVAIRTGKPGTTAVVGADLDGANCIDLILIRRSPRFDSRFMAYVMNSDLAHAQYAEGSEGALQQHFNIETAKNLVVPAPPLAEQRAIAADLDARLARHDALRARATEMIERLREHRAALITAAVTGGIAAARPLADQGPARAAAA